MHKLIESDNMKTLISFDSASGKFVGSVDGKVVVRSKYESAVKTRLAEMSGTIVEAQKAFEEKSEKFDINTRFGFVEKLVTMVASGVQPSAVITGEGGLGKTYTVTKTLESHGYKDISDLADFEVGAVINTRKCFTFVKGYSTAKGLYRTLFENNKSIIVFDDCDAVLKDPVALNILKGALDSYGKRIISWNADMRDDDLPKSFNFEGRVIFISNMNQDKIDQAIRSRSMMIDLSMTTNQKIDRMEHISKLDEFLPEYDAAVKSDALALIRAIKDDVKEISLRTLIAVAKVRASNKDWKDLATYMLTA
jgi:ATPase family associated with various cellular activities (AAA)